MTSLTKIISSGTDRKSNVMTPLNWFAGISQSILFPAGAVSYDNWYGKACFVMGSIVFLFYGGVYLYFAFKDPDRLQTEEYNLLNQGIQVSGKAENIIVDSIDPSSIASMTAGHLPEKK